MAKFVRKRDPRHKAYLARQAEKSQSQTPGSATPVGSTSRKRPQVVEAYVEQEWQKVDSAHIHADLDWAAAEGEDSEEWECVACRKSFRSEAAWDSHERSKKHMKEVERLRNEMLEQNEEFGLDGEEEEVLEEQEEEVGEEQEEEVGEEQEEEEEETGTEQRSEELDIHDPPPSIPSPAVVPTVAIDEPPIPLPSPSEIMENEGEQNLSRRSKKPGKKSSRAPTVSAPPTKTQRKVKRAPQSEKLRSEKVGPRDSSDLETTLPDGAATNILPEVGGLTHGGSQLKNNDDMHQQAADHSDANIPTELTKREKRRARQAKKAEAGELPVSEVTHLHLNHMYCMNSDMRTWAVPL